MHKTTGLLVAIIGAILLSGCTTYKKAESYLTEPVVKNVKKGMSRQQVHTIAGQPATRINMTFARGSCETYVIGEDANKKPLTYFVSYTEGGHVLNYGFQSCADYDSDPLVHH